MRTGAYSGSDAPETELEQLPIVDEGSFAVTLQVVLTTRMRSDWRAIRPPAQ